jgi:chorismate mutase
MSKPTDEHRQALQLRRKQIDLLDAELLRLLNERATIANELAAIKKDAGLPVYDGDREQQILDRVCVENQGPLESQSITCIFRCIIRESRRVEETSMRQLETNYFEQENSNGNQHGSRRVRS